MAELTAARHNALPYPVYGVPWVAVFPLLDADGDPISPSSPDSERSLNCDTFADCTNEATEIATSSGICYLILTAAEMTADVVAVRVQSTGAKTTVLNFAPRKLVPLRTGTSAGGATGSITLDSGANATDDFYNGCLCVAVIDGTTEARIIDDYVGSTKVASVTPDWNVAPDADDTFTVYLPEGIQVNQASVTHWNGSTVASPDTAGYPKVTVKSGTGTGELNVASGIVDADVREWLGTAAATPTTAGVPEVDVTHWVGGVVPATTQSGVPEVDLTHILGASVNPSGSAQIGVNIINAAGTLWNSGAITASTIANAAIDAATFAADARMIAAGKPGSVNDASPAAGDFDGDAGLSATDDFYNGSVLAFTSGSLLGIARKITDYTGSSKNLVFATAFPAAPADTDTFVILGRIE